MRERRRSKALGMDALMEKVLQRGAFENRSHLGTLSREYREMLGDQFGEVIERQGDVLIIRVKGAPLRSELESFKKWELLECLQRLYHQH